MLVFVLSQRDRFPCMNCFFQEITDLFSYHLLRSFEISSVLFTKSPVSVEVIYPAFCGGILSDTKKIWAVINLN